MSEANDVDRGYAGLEIAVIGMAGRFPAAENLDQFWANLIGGVDAISRFTKDELSEVGVSRELLDDGKYVRMKGAFPRIEFFDSAFFDYTPADATLLDPQVRALHEEVYHALEDAGYSAQGRSESIGLFLGATNNLAWELHTLGKYIQASGLTYSGTQLNDKDFAATRIAYALGLKGPALTLHTACSTSLVAVDLACRSLWTGACQIAVAGGSGLTLPHKNGYLYQENMIHSPDGRCRAFDKDAKGTVEGNGAGVVVLKRLETALRDRDRVYAVIKGCAVNNDGNRKVGYTAPSIEGQSEVIRKAYRVARVSPADVSYVETHGTGTPLGDPIEFEALRKVFDSGRPATCGIGSLKASIGHLDAAAGIASFIKTCKILEEQLVPGSLHFNEPNPNISFIDSPFYVVAEKEELPRKHSAAQIALPLRAGVSSFGIGGSNAHVVLEEAPIVESGSASGREYNTFVVSAISAEAIRRIKQNFARYLAAHPDVDGSDLAWTLQNRQRRLRYRYAVEFKDARQLRKRLQESLDTDEKPARLAKNARNNVYFLFSGAETKHLRMARDLYRTEESFRAHLDACLSISDAMGNGVPREVFFGDCAAAEKRLNDIETTQTLLFMIEYSVARTLIGWAVKPKGAIGHGIGELAAACVSGVFSVEDGIRLARARGSLMNATPESAVTAVKAPEDVVRPMLTGELAMGAVNSPQDCAVTGPPAAVSKFETLCAERGIDFARVDADHAYHSQYMGSVLGEFREAAQQVTFHQPKIPYISSVTGTWITPDQATDPAYYCAQARDTVQFKRGVETIMEREDPVFVEVGPGQSLSSFVRDIAQGTDVVAVNMLRHRLEEIGDDEHLARAVKKLWQAGVAFDWKAYHQGRRPRKLSLPLYPFDEIEYPVDVRQFQLLRSDLGDGPKRMAAVDRRTPGLEVAGVDGLPPALRIVWSELSVPRGKESQKVLIVFTEAAAKLKPVLDQIPHWRAIYVAFGQEYQFHGWAGAVVRAHHEDDLKRLVDDLESHALAGDTFAVHHDSYASLTTTMRELCDVIAGMRQPCVRDLVVLDTGDFLRCRFDFLPRILGLNHEHPDVRIMAIRGDPDVARREARKAWAACLQTELEVRRPDDVAVRYVGGRRLVPVMMPVHGRRDSVRDRAGRTVIFCRADDVGDLLDEMADGNPARVLVVPFDLRSDTGTVHASAGSGRVTVLPAVTGQTWEELAAALSARVRDLLPIDELVVWDARGQNVADSGVDHAGLVDRRNLLGWFGALSRELRISCHVLARPNLDRDGWDGDLTRWFVENELIDARVGLSRLYAFGRVAYGDQSVLDLLAHMDQAGARTAYHGLDLLRAQSAARMVSPEDETEPGDERRAIAAMIGRELAQLLGYSEVDTRADMVELGLDSVKLVQFATALERKGHKILHSDVYTHPTVDSLAGLLTDRTAKQVGQDGSSFESIATRLEERLQLACDFHEFRPGPDDDALVLLFVDGLDNELKGKVIREIKDLQVPSRLEPHYILPRTMEEDFLLDRSFRSLGIGAGPASRAGGVQAVFEEIDRRQAELRNSIGAQPVKWTYPISGMQKRHFAGEARLQLYLIRFRELIDAEVLQQALADVIGRHGLLRSFLSRSFRRLRWKEFEAPATIALPTLDMSSLEPGQQDDLRAELVKREWNINFKVVDKPMYQVVLLKYNERCYDLLFEFDHSIFDAASGQLLRADLQKRYEELLAGTSRAMPVAKSNRHLQDQINKGPVDITPDEIIERFELKKYVHHAKILQQKTARHANNRIHDVRYSLDLRRLQQADDGELESFSLVVHLYARIVARLMNVDKVAMDIVFQSRVFEDKDYSEIMGMALGGLPVVISGERDTKDDLKAIITDKIRLLNKHNVSFLNLAHNLPSLIKHRKILSMTMEVSGKSFRPTCLLNFVGNVEDEYDAVWDMMLEQLTEDQDKLDYADCYCVSKISNGRLDLLVLCKWAKHPGDIVTVLDEEVEYLTRYGIAGTDGITREG